MASGESGSTVVVVSPPGTVVSDEPGVVVSDPPVVDGVEVGGGVEAVVDAVVAEVVGGAVVGALVVGVVVVGSSCAPTGATSAARSERTVTARTRERWVACPRSLCTEIHRHGRSRT